MTQKEMADYLSAKNKRIDQVSRLHYLQELERFFKEFYIPYSQAVDKPYSCQERRILVRIIKLLIHQLKGTVTFHLFSGKHARRKPVDPAEDQELHNQETDEIRIQHTRLTWYNPVSEKYKLKKEELLRELEAMDKE